MKAIIYCRVSTETQEEKGTSLKTQLENCLAYCERNKYEIVTKFSETYSGLSLERPEFDKVRELVRNESFDVLVCYSLDRLSRDPTHGVIITQELERHKVKLETVSEDTSNSELGKLISYIRGYASKLEAEKIRERSIRGRRAWAKAGRMTGGFHGTYGYDYVPKTQHKGGYRVINENEVEWVKKIFRWLVYDGLTTGYIRNKLQELNVPTKKGGNWSKVAINGILKNPAYTGKTYAFTCVNRKARKKPREEWIEIPGVTPAIIDQALFDAAQKQLQVNREKSPRNIKHDYLLRGHIRCRRCGHTYSGGVTKNRDGSDRRLYRCLGKWKERQPEICTNKSWGADKLENLVWIKLHEYISDKNFIKNAVEDPREHAARLESYQNEIRDIERQLKNVDKEQHRLLQWAVKDFPAAQVEAENKRINKARESLEQQKTDIQGKIEQSKKAISNAPQIEAQINKLKANLDTLDYKGKRLALDMLGITVWLDGEKIDVTGTVKLDRIVTKTALQKERYLNNYINFTLKIDS